MLDNLRDQAASPQNFEENEPKPELPGLRKPPKRRKTLDQAIGMTAPQRFFVAFMLFIMVFLLGTALLVVTGTVVIPGLTF